MASMSNLTLRPQEPVQTRRGWVGFVVVGLTVLAPALAGSTALWAEGVLAVLTGVLFLAAPPARSLGLLANIFFAALVCIALTAFLPANWFGNDPVRQMLSGLGIPLPGTHTLQPWITLEATLLLIMGLAWAYYLLGYDWGRQRFPFWMVFALFALLLAALMVTGKLTGWRVPFWPNVPEFGFFPNRNQTSNVLALSGMLLYAIGLQRLQEHRVDWWAWFAALSLICWALIINYSRAGLVLLLAGTFIVQVYWWLTSTDHRRTSVSLLGLLLILGVFLLNGGAILHRFRTETADFLSVSRNFRLNIYRDAFALLPQTPLFGFGLGNFHPIFAVHRNYSLAPNETIHPESDWLWAALEMGWITPLIVLVLLGWWLWQCFPLNPRTSRTLRFAALVCGALFALHGVFDVSGHRIGALWPALFLTATAARPERFLKGSLSVPIIFRFVGVILLISGSVWIASEIGDRNLPTTATLRHYVVRANDAVRENRFNEAIEPATRGLRIAPLNWMLYHNRGVAVAALYHANAEAVRDFQAARYLLPQWSQLYMREAQVWIAVGEPDRAFAIWAEVLKRFQSEAPRYYRDMLDIVKNDPELVDRWRELGRTDPRCVIVSLRNANEVEMRLELDRLFHDDPELRAFSLAQRKIIVQEWYRHGDRLDLVQTLQSHAEWQELAWHEMAHAYGDLQDYRPAYETILLYLPKPDLPKPSPAQDLAALQSRFRNEPNNPDAGLILASAQIAANEIDGAIRTLNLMASEPKMPGSVFFLLGQALAQKEDWLKAWQSMAKYESSLPQQEESDR